MVSKFSFSLLFSCSLLLTHQAKAMEDPSLELALREYRTFAVPVLRKQRLRDSAQKHGVIRAEQIIKGDEKKQLISRHRVAEDVEDLLSLSPTGTKICFYNSQDQTLELRRVGGKKVYQSIDLSSPNKKIQGEPSVTWSADEKYLLVIHLEHSEEYGVNFPHSTSLTLIDIETGEKILVSELSNLPLQGIGLAARRGRLNTFENKIYFYENHPGNVTLYYVYDIDIKCKKLLDVFPFNIGGLVVLDDGTPYTATSERKKLEEFFVWEEGEFISRYAVTSAQKERGHRFVFGNERQVLTLQPVNGDKVVPVLVEFKGRTRTETPLFSDDQIRALEADVSGVLSNFERLGEMLIYQVRSLKYQEYVMGDWTGHFLAGFKGPLEELAKLSFTWNVFEFSEDFRRLLISLESPEMPKTLRICEYDNGALQVLEEFSLTPWLNSLQSLYSPVQTVHYKSFDGLEIPAILTRPSQAKPGEKLPTVLLVHGGPVARDKWVFDPQVQYLASRGYQFLQPQFRGTKGFGLKFTKAIFGHWDDAVRDVIAGREWLVEQGLADPDRMVIMGASFGGWTALQALTDYPGMFQCGIANCPVTDPETDILRKDISRSEAEYWIRHFGKARPETVEGRAVLRRFSPLQNASKIQEPVLLMHGELDETVKFSQSALMAERLQDLRKSHIFIRFPGEKHGNIDAEALRVEFAAIDYFLARYLRGVPYESLQDELRRTSKAVLVSHRE